MAENERDRRPEPQNAGDPACPPPAALRASAPPKSPAPPAQGGDPNRSAGSDAAAEGARSVRATACGKVILLGEHAVVYGVPALAAGIDRGARAEATKGSEAAPGSAASPEHTLSLGGRSVTPDAGGPEDIARAFAALLGNDAPAAAITAASELPAGGGLGSSAALGVAIARAIEELAGTAPGEREARALARAIAWERVFHGNPSGIDTYAAAHGGTFRFVRGEPARPLHLGADLWLCVGMSGSGASTRAMVEGLAQLFQRKPDLKRRSIEAIEALVSNAALAIEAGDLAALGKLMDLNHMLLAGLFLSTEALERLCHLARQAGALGAKLTGSGGGGSVIALVPPPARDDGSPGEIAAAVIAAWKDAGFEGFVTRIARPRETG
jgi:mevalonate kinase